MSIQEWQPAGLDRWHPNARVELRCTWRGRLKKKDITTHLPYLRMQGGGLRISSKDVHKFERETPVDAPSCYWTVEHHRCVHQLFSTAKLGWYTPIVRSSTIPHPFVAVAIIDYIKRFKRASQSIICTWSGWSPCRHLDTHQTNIQKLSSCFFLTLPSVKETNEAANEREREWHITSPHQ